MLSSKTEFWKLCPKKKERKGIQIKDPRILQKKKIQGKCHLKSREYGLHLAFKSVLIRFSFLGGDYVELVILYWLGSLKRCNANITYQKAFSFTRCA